ncbi:MAG TPA: HWE histidine kinase domain-containing protein [Beijerinckiaceae bacterium]|nr:HWE histidine kinase domain-containing protein [Beijerinckiaceae bacterium]
MDTPNYNFLEAAFEKAVVKGGPEHGKIQDDAQRDATPDILREREHQFHQLLDALPAAVYTTDAAGRITYYNDAAAELWGHRPDLGTVAWCGAWKFFRPDGTPLPHDACPMAMALKEDRPIRGMEAIIERPDGIRVPFLPYPTPLHDQSGALVGAVNMLLDISEKKRAEEHHALLIRELHHRVKNTLATVQAIMSSTARTASSIAEFEEKFIGRVGSLSRTHSLLTEDVRQTTRFGDLLRNELDAFDDGSQRIRLKGPFVELSSDLAVPIGMAIHELATNAARHGSLSVPDGRLEVRWSVSIEAEGSKLLFQWLEQDGPPLEKPRRPGFGTRLLERVLTSQVSAEVAIGFEGSGIRINVAVPLPNAPTPASG